MSARASGGRFRVEEFSVDRSAAAELEVEHRTLRGRFDGFGRDGIVVRDSAEATIELHFELDLPTSGGCWNSGIRNEGAEFPHWEYRRVFIIEVNRKFFFLE